MNMASQSSQQYNFVADHWTIIKFTSNPIKLQYCHLTLYFNHIIELKPHALLYMFAAYAITRVVWRLILAF